MIRIISKKDGFRRCGVAHSETATDYDDSHFSKKELKRLKNEPMLIVQELPGKPKSKEEGEEKK